MVFGRTGLWYWEQWFWGGEGGVGGGMRTLWLTKWRRSTDALMTELGRMTEPLLGTETHKHINSRVFNAARTV